MFLTNDTLSFEAINALKDEQKLVGFYRAMCVCVRASLTQKMMLKINMKSKIFIQRLRKNFLFFVIKQRPAKTRSLAKNAFANSGRINRMTSRPKSWRAWRILPRMRKNNVRKTGWRRKDLRNSISMFNKFCVCV